MAENIFTLSNSDNWFDMSDLCRICGTVSRQFFSIFQDDDVDRNLRKIITKHMPMLEVSKNDPLPAKVCYTCASTLVSWNEFCSTAIKANKLMKSFLPQNFDDLCKEEIAEIDENGETIKEEQSADAEFEDFILDSSEDDKILQKNKAIGRLKFKRIECPECDKTFEWKENLKEHIKYMHRKVSSERIQCPQCDGTFGWKKSLVLHMRRQHGEEEPRKFACDLCDKRYMVNKDLLDHMNVHTGERPFACDFCDKTFGWKKSMKHHIKRVHIGLPRKFPCDVCEKRFKAKKDLEIHKVIHTGKRPFVCDMCGKSFTQQASLMAHRKFELGLLKHDCEICSKSFTSKRTLRKHVNSVHLDICNYECNICGKEFRRLDTFKNHATVHTSDQPFSCDTCKKTFRYKKGLQRHLSNQNCGV